MNFTVQGAEKISRNWFSASLLPLAARNAREVTSKSSCRLLHSNPAAILPAAHPAAAAAPVPLITAAPAARPN